MSLSSRSFVAIFIMPLFLSACSDRTVDVVPADIVWVTDQWLGQWNGPEGTFLRLEGGNGRYEITIQNLDGPRTFPGSAADEQIHFERSGVKETIRATDGAETGMKWLSDKANCLTVRPGEGYCRD